MPIDGDADHHCPQQRFDQNRQMPTESRSFGRLFSSPIPVSGMKIVYLTAGAAGMYCGSCMHDNTLARALAQQGVDVQLVPTYTPIRTDEHNVSVDQVFFGGINVYLQQKIPLLRMLPKLFDRVLDSPWLIRRVTRNATSISPEELGKLTCSMLLGEKGFQKKEVKRLVHWLKHQARPDRLIFTNALIAGCIPTIRRELGIPCYVTLQGDDIFLDSLPDSYRTQSITSIGQLQNDIFRFIAHSEFYADYMATYFSLERNRIAVTPLGIDVDDYQRRLKRERNPQPTIGYLARLAPEKGLDLLVDAFILLKQQGRNADVRLKIAGWLGGHNQAYAEEQFDKLRRAGLENEFEYAGTIERDQKIEFLSSLDVLSVPTRYRDPKGLFVLEAMAAGVPVVQPEHGAFPEVIASTGGGLLFPPDDTAALAETLTNLFDDEQLRLQLADAGYENVRAQRNSRIMAQQLIELISADDPGI